TPRREASPGSEALCGRRRYDADRGHRRVLARTSRSKELERKSTQRYTPSHGRSRRTSSRHRSRRLRISHGRDGRHALILLDVNVLVYAHRPDAPDHASYREWLEGQINSDAAFGLADLVLSGFLRVATHPRVFQSPSKLSDASKFIDQLR